MTKSSLPRIGEVICHAYLWRNQANRGQTEGTKERPCVVVHQQEESDGNVRVYVLPITHTKPYDLERAIDCPNATKQRLGLDARASWIVTSELNHFIWPGFDVRPTPDNRPSYGLLPNKLTRRIIEQIKDNSQDQTLSAVNRDE
ncbi:MAG: hypothetical protein V3U65_06225 [Granulosicoccaceae bacterium]